MFSFLRLQRMVLVLIVGVLVLGFMLTGDVVQKSLASDSDCDEAWLDYGRATLDAYVICAGNSDSSECGGAWLRAAYYFARAVIICLG